VVLPIMVLAALVIDVSIAGASRIDASLLTSPALGGSVLLVGLTAAIALPIGIGAAIYLEEYGDRGPGRVAQLSRVIDVNVSNLAGVPSILYGLLGLELFAGVWGLGYGLLAAALTMALLVLPIVIMAARDALRGVPATLREAGLALGATRSRVIGRIVLPMALPGILSGAIKAATRVLGEAAPLLILGTLTWGREGPFTVLPVAIFRGVTHPEAGSGDEAAAAIVVLLVVLLALNSIALGSRSRAARLARGGE
jgi:phosphate transport system permease protein